MKVGDIVRIMLDGHIGIVTKTNMLHEPNMVEILINGNRATYIQPYYLKVISESR